MKSLDIKLKNIISSNYNASDFIIADAKDADMAAGIRAPGYIRKDNAALTEQPASYENYLNKMESMTKSEEVDIMLMSMTSAERLINKKIFENNSVTPAIRLNDTSCTWGMIRNGEYNKDESRAFATTRLNHAINFVDLGLYSITFNKNVDRDVSMLNQYRNFRIQAEELKMRHFLEVFNSAVIDLSITEMGEYVNDCILKTLSGQISSERPLFLKIQYNGPKAMEELSAYDPTGLVIGILGGSQGTSRDCFELIFQAHKYGARVALFGRKINLSEDQNTMVKTMKKVIHENLESEEAVKYYHDSLLKINIKPDRDLEKDIELTDPALKF
mgnify:CR=1 FL=1